MTMQIILIIVHIGLLYMVKGKNWKKKYIIGQNISGLQVYVEVFE